MGRGTVLRRVPDLPAAEQTLRGVLAQVDAEAEVALMDGRDLFPVADRDTIFELPTPFANF